VIWKILKKESEQVDIYKAGTTFILPIRTINREVVMFSLC